MGTSSRRSPKAPGTRGAHYDPTFENPSRFICWPPNNGAETVCAAIFFATNEDAVHGTDLTVAQMVAQVMRYHDTLGDDATCLCEGSADVRHDSLYNLALSERRAESVAKAIRQGLPVKLHARVTSRGVGEALSHSQSTMWAEDRRVDVKIRVHGLHTTRARLGFEADENNKVEMVFLKSLETLEVNGNGNVMTWLRTELKTLWETAVDRAGPRFNQPSAVHKRHAGMGFDGFLKLSRGRVTACVRLRYSFDNAKNLHRLSGQILDASNMRPMFPMETVEAGRFLDLNGTSYLSSPKDNPLQIWRHLPAGQTAPSGARTRSVRGTPEGLLAKPQDLWDKLRARFKTITERVQSTM